MTANVARPTVAGFPAAPQGGRGGGRGTAAKSGVGEPEEGSIILKELAGRAAAAPPPNFNAGRGRGAAGGPPRRQPNYL